MPNKSVAMKVRPGLFVAGYAVFIFLLVYLWTPARPGITSPLGWYDAWNDQTAYYNMLRSMPATMGTFEYPVVYPLMGYVARLFCPYDPFLPVDLLLFTAFIWFSWRNFSVFLSPGVALIGAAVLVHVSVVVFVQPWTSSVSAAGIALLIYGFLHKLYSLRWGLVSGLTLALIFGARPQDAVAAGLVVALALILPHTRRWFAAVAVSALAIAAVLVTINYHYSHLLMGPYYQRGMSQGLLHIADIPRNLYGYFLDPWLFDHDYMSRAVFLVCPLLLLVPIGLAYLMRNPATRLVAVSYGVAAVGWFAVYSGYYSLNGGTLKYGSLHYAKLLFPIFLGSGMYAAVELERGTEGKEEIRKGHLNERVAAEAGQHELREPARTPSEPRRE